MSFRDEARVAASARIRAAITNDSLLNRRRRKDLARIVGPRTLDAENICTRCGVPDVHCQCPDVDTNEGLWQADDVADSYEEET